jgi:uncharacterized membrane protein
MSATTSNIPVKPPQRSMMKWALHDSFRAGITIKGIDGLLEAVGGVLIWFVKPTSLDNLSLWAFDHELPLHMNDFLADHVFKISQHLANGGKMFATIYLISHGLLKALLVTGLWFDKLWAYPATIAVFTAFSFYQIYRFTHTHSLALAWLTVFDVLIIYLTWREYREQKAK